MLTDPADLLRQRGYRVTGQRLAVLLWGPGAGFLLALTVMAAYSALFGFTPADPLEPVPIENLAKAGG